ncbi:MAG: crotonase/enoyl-CoA hydratase family protein [Pseudohongiella sp.]|nr:crotonase/enoyl-CoA hydratase family protein [Pseudohongiella sp.]MDO9519449.1 crotonase/enoyl-CoA hydratase family protein [Pseudohongiella sp.]MDP2127543.1 crotonase/enoyl-CoA hydratase family protein [Pseudohongiella sp.]
MSIPGVNSDRVTLSIDNGIADIRLNRADKRNALDSEMFSSLAAMGEHIKTLATVRVVVLSGEGASFCAGLDFASFHVMAAGGSATGFKKDGQFNAGALTDGGLTHLAQQICWVWQQIPVPVIAAIHGHALGGGIQLALGSDIRFVHPDTQMSVREIYWGIIPDMTGTLTLSRLVRPDIAKELVFTGKIIDGREAHRIGLATHLSDSPRDDAMALAREIAGRNPHAVRGAKHLLNLQVNASAAAQFAAEREVIFSLMGSDNQKEAVAAHFEKRDPRFTDPA